MFGFGKSAEEVELRFMARSALAKLDAVLTQVQTRLNNVSPGVAGGNDWLSALAGLLSSMNTGGNRARLPEGRDREASNGAAE